LVVALFSVAFGAMLLSIVLWDQTVWGWSALKIGVAMAPGPLLVPIVSMLFSRRLIARFGAAPVVVAGLLLFALGLAWWALVPGVTPSVAAAVIGMLPIGAGVGLTLPTLMGVSTSSLPPSSCATGSGVVNMIRQAGMAIGVAVLVALIGSPASAAERIEAFQSAWWIMSVVLLFGLIPTLTLIRVRANGGAANKAPGAG
ncbi:MAG TPA: MFS transporter, partial [Burkholderiales bacterium]|nr:MFS transporter [Burkholderiales bacterium]